MILVTTISFLSDLLKKQHETLMMRVRVGHFQSHSLLREYNVVPMVIYNAETQMILDYQWIYIIIYILPMIFKFQSEFLNSKFKTINE